MQCEMRCKSRSRGLDTVFPDLLGRRSLPYLNDIEYPQDIGFVVATLVALTPWSATEVATTMPEIRAQETGQGIGSRCGS